jgi:hypothetical protein
MGAGGERVHHVGLHGAHGRADREDAAQVERVGHGDGSMQTRKVLTERDT